MAYAKPLFSVEEYNDAARAMVAPSLWVVENEAATVRVANWRLSHSYPLNARTETLKNRARSIDSTAVVARRLKRLPSIENKLKSRPWMNLTQMQDIGGCRAVVADMAAVTRLVEWYRRDARQRPEYHQGFKESDYLSKPKADGYRSHHIVYRYFSTSPHSTPYNGMKIEIQIRTRIQHAWATALETVDAFSGQELKAGRGESEWRRFFSLASGIFAITEGTTDVPGLPDSLVDLIQETQDLMGKLKVITTLNAWRLALQVPSDHVPPGTKAFLLYLDLRPAQPQLRITHFTATQLPKAAEEYVELEKEISDNPRAQVVLVQVESLASLSAAYPNYYGDTQFFLEQLGESMSAVIARLRAQHGLDVDDDEPSLSE